MKDVRVELKWWLIFATVGLLWMLMKRVRELHGTNIEYRETFEDLFVVPAVVVYVLALHDKRESYSRGRMIFREGLNSGLFLTAIISLMSPIATSWIEPDCLQA